MILWRFHKCIDQLFTFWISFEYVHPLSVAILSADSENQPSMPYFISFLSIFFKLIIKNKKIFFILFKWKTFKMHLNNLCI